MLVISLLQENLLEIAYIILVQDSAGEVEGEEEVMLVSMLESPS
tara:strand:- start:160 stop:291 length:132 start_codon:yes stop_codon:yes gene_type:complete